MGENEGWAEPGGPLPNGLLPGAGRVMRALDIDRWSRAEERTAELIACIQPNQFSEERRNAVADYVQRLIMKCFQCQVCTFGSVPLKTYLPDGDIDLTAFSHDQIQKESWPNLVRDMLENEEKNEHAEFHVKEVQYIQAEVKLIKCLVENIVVDISFNQVGGLCTLCFLDEVDNLINQNHLFKRSIILIKAWCYYESRILGAHHGLISTYALETLVLYIFHVFNNSFHGPLEVLYRFLEFFSNFDWDNFCVSLWGPVPISSLPDVTAEPPRKDSGDLLLSKLFLDACSSVYAVFPGGQENNGQPFVSKHFNVIDPLRVNNNLGRSVSKGNFFRIRSAFAFGAKRLARLLDCPKENLTFEVNQFFLNTWERHGSGNRPDAPGVNSWRVNLSTPEGLHEIGNSNENKSRNNNNVSENSSIHYTEDKGVRGRGVSNQHGKTTLASHVKSQNSNILRVTDQNDEDQRDSKTDHLVNDTQGRFLFARTRSSPELTANNRRKNLGSAEDSRNIPSRQSVVDADEFLSTSGAMNQEEQDIVNMMASASLQNFNGHQIQVPFNLNSSHHLPFSIPPSFLASMGYTQQNLPGFIPGNIPLMDPSFANLQFPHGLVPPQLNHYFHSPSEASFEQTNENFGSVEMNSEEADNENFWQQEQDVCSSAGYDPENGNFEMLQSDDKPQPASISGLKYVPPPRVSGTSSTRGQQKNTREKWQNSFPNQDESCAEERSASSRFSSATHSNSLRSRTSSESSWDGSTVKTPKSTKQKQGKKIISADHLSTDLGKGKIMSEHAEDDDQEWGSFPNVGPTETVERNDSMIPFAPMLIRPGSRHQRNDDNSGLIAFYPTGPPIPFLTMLPVPHYNNIPPETSTSDETVENSESGQNFSSSERFDHLDDPNLNSLRGTTSTSANTTAAAAAAAETSEKKKPDILNSDFASHWQNLQFGRFCQNPRPLLHPSSPVMVPPVYLQGGRFPYDSNPGRPVSANNMNLFSQLMTSYGQRIVPVGPIQSVSNRPPNMYQRYVDDMPRYRSGTGTYLPTPKVSPRDRHSSGNRRGNYGHDRNDNYNEREGNWNASKSRAALRRNQSDKSNSRADKSDRAWNSYRHEAVPSYQSQNGPLTSNSGQDVPYNMYPNPNGASNGPPVPPMVMLYPFEHNAANYASSHSEQLEFGSLGPVGLPGMDDQSSLNEGARPNRTFEDHRLHGTHSSPDQPSSPHHQRRI